MTKWEGFFRPKKTKAGKTVFGSLGVKTVSVLFVCPLGVLA
jgi:hypothetical protein